MNLYDKLAHISAEIATVSKNLSIQAGKNSYKAVGEADVLAAVKPLEEKYRIYSYPCKREIVESNVFTKRNTYHDQTTETTQLFMRVKTTYRFVDIDAPSDYIEIDTYGDGVDTQDKAPGKAMTYADKYALLKAYKVTTGDDPDQVGSADMGTARKGKEPTLAQCNELRSLNRSIAHVAKKFGVAETAVTADHVEQYLEAARAYQAKKDAAIEKEAQELFAPVTLDDDEDKPL